MKNLIILMFVLTLGSVAYAEQIWRSCSVTLPGDGKYELLLGIKKTSRGHSLILVSEEAMGSKFPYPGGEGRVAIVPTPSAEVYPRVAILDENGNFKNLKDRIEIFGDSAGCAFAYLVLWKNSNFTTGYFRHEDMLGGGDNHYVEVTCSSIEPQW